MSSELQRILADIRFEADRIVSDVGEGEFAKCGGIADPALDHTKMIKDLGARRAAEVARHFGQLRAALRNFYGLNPLRQLEHANVLRTMRNNGWLRG